MNQTCAIFHVPDVAFDDCRINERAWARNLCKILVPILDTEFSRDRVVSKVSKVSSLEADVIVCGERMRLQHVSDLTEQDPLPKCLGQVGVEYVQRPHAMNPTIGRLREASRNNDDRAWPNGQTGATPKTALGLDANFPCQYRMCTSS